MLSENDKNHIVLLGDFEELLQKMDAMRFTLNK